MKKCQYHQPTFYLKVSTVAINELLYLKNAGTQICLMFFSSYETMAIEKIKIQGPFLSYKLNSSANPVLLPKTWAKCAELAVLFTWELKNGPQDFDLP